MKGSGKNVQKRTNRLREALARKEFVVTCEMIPGRGAREPAQESLFEQATRIWDTGLIHAISITDNPGGNPALLADAVGEEFCEEGITPLVHFTCKDRTRNQIQSQLYALQRKNVDNLLVMTGDYPVGGWSGRSKPCFDLDSVQALMMAKNMNEGLIQTTSKGDHREQAADFLLGAVVNPFKYIEGEVITQYAKLAKKLFAGADYLITQLGYDTKKLDELQRFVKSLGSEVPLIANVFVLSLGAARLMRSGAVAGCYVSDELFSLLKQEATADDKGKAARLERAAKLVAASRVMGFAGVHLGGLGLTAENVTEILSRALEWEERGEALLSELSFGESQGFYYYQNPSKESTAPGDIRTPLDVYQSKRVLTRGYSLSRFFHSLVLSPGKGFYGVLEAQMERKENKMGRYRKHGFEHFCKSVLYDCQDCGDCGLESVAYLCPQSQCPKNQRNGPCGGSIKGYCEVYPAERYCVWQKTYQRLKKYQETEKLFAYITPPNNWGLNSSSSWSNYTHKRDNAAFRVYLTNEQREENHAE